MHRNNSVRRGLAVAAAAAGLWALGTAGAQADEPPAGAGVLHGVTDGTHGTHGTHGTRQLLQEAPRTAGRAAMTKETEQGVRQGVGKAVGNVTEEAGQAVSTASQAPADTDMAAVSGIPAASAAPSAPGLPEDFVIGVPQLLPGVPAVGVVPLSLPELPVTPTVPSL